MRGTVVDPIDARGKYRHCPTSTVTPHEVMKMYYRKKIVYVPVRRGRRYSRRRGYRRRRY